MAEAGPEERAPRIDWPATVAGAGAAVTVAVLLSTLGAAGTLIGAALGSVVATISTALYKQGIESSRRRVAEVQAAALQREAARAHRHVEAPELTDAAGAEDDAQDDEAADAGASLADRWAALPWKRIAVLAAALFVLTLVVISAVELIAGRSVSTITGGTDGKDRTSIGGVFGDGGSGGKDEGEQQQELPAEQTPTPTPTPTDTGSTVAPTEPATPTAPVTPTAPSDLPAPTGTATVTETVTPTLPPSAIPSPTATP
ncbi:hypothetical protein [Pimelobacter simplex]|uniref:hypothetical protein n=1 Tax=Nocardioides simplex TaxID=2045 RepID=UPI0019326E9C|nr:hypothetical protein [Pimelobacter simplex]